MNIDTRGPIFSKREVLHQFQKRDGAAIGGTIVGVIFWIIVIWAIVACIRRRRSVVVIQQTEQTTQHQTNVEMPNTQTQTNSTTGANITFVMGPQGGYPHPGAYPYPVAPMPTMVPGAVHAQHDGTAIHQATMTTGGHAIQKTQVEVTTTEAAPPVEAPPSYQQK